MQNNIKLHMQSHMENQRLKQKPGEQFWLLQN